jgi:hypothetical protein
MQRLHEDDLVDHVLAQEPWEVVHFPAIADLARSMHDGWRVWRKRLIGRRIRLQRLNLPVVGGNTRHG